MKDDGKAGLPAPSGVEGKARLYDSEAYEALESDIRRDLQAVSTSSDAMTLVVGRLKALPHYSWVGIYQLDRDELVLGPFLGKPSPHVRIPLERGICGAAATTKSTIVVDDVNRDPRYLACSVETQSEIVVPIMRGDQVLGEIDIDSDTLAAFGAEDRRMLEAVAAMLAEKMLAEKL